MDALIDLDVKIDEAKVYDQPDLAPLKYINDITELFEEIVEKTVATERELVSIWIEAFIQDREELETVGIDNTGLIYPLIFKSIALSSPYILQILSMDDSYLSDFKYFLETYDKQEMPEKINKFPEKYSKLLIRVFDIFSSVLKTSRVTEEESNEIVINVLISLLEYLPTSAAFVAELQNQNENAPESEIKGHSISADQTLKIFIIINQIMIEAIFFIKTSFKSTFQILNSTNFIFRQKFKKVFLILNQIMTQAILFIKTSLKSTFQILDLTNLFPILKTLSEWEGCQVLPPWLWLWFAFYLYSIPSLLGRFQRNYSNLFSLTYPVNSNTTNFFYLLLLPGITELILHLILFLGIFSVVFPQWRKYYVERKYKLTENYMKIPAIIEIEDFLKFHDPNLQIKTNLLSQSEEVFIYPLGYRKTGIAIFGKFIKSWRIDKERSQKVLLHEIGHHRNGDALILGIYSFFVAFLRHSLMITTLILLIPMVLFFATVIFPSLPLVSNWISQLILFIVEMILLLFVLFFQTASIFTLPIIGMWAVELNADRFMLASNTNSTEESLKLIGKLKIKNSFKIWFLDLIFHPPNILRRWMVTHHYEKKSIFLYLLLYPVADLFQLFMALMYELCRYIMYYLSGLITITEIIENMYNYIKLYMDSRSFIWLFISIIVLFWPFVAVYWDELFSGIREISNLKNYRGYFLCASIFVVVSIIIYYCSPLIGV
ncbi:hypothetical protein MSKOL_3069 [Methanosarcina sp. Kolksee]|uniref:hypothetical protein n=1 Tax=Methanosarcina sp. Kolksee TaxID=1434099 RepID=UPI0006157F37|nr:hypothetical protein [Methanosarcina sp. Kolksee]AKB48846.1 hypothetical protein MSKOL_3069 [Methanosarcina sp. Kolksee]